MRARSLEGMRWFRGLVLGLGALACASAATDTAGTSKTLRDVKVAREGDATVVTLIGVADPVYTAYLQQDPQRLTIDLASVQVDSMRDPIAVYDGLAASVEFAGAAHEIQRCQWGFHLAASSSVAICAHCVAWFRYITHQGGTSGRMRYSDPRRARRSENLFPRRETP